MRTSIQLVNPSPGATMKHAKKHSRRARRHNPSGKAAASAAMHTGAKILAGTVGAYAVAKVVGMKKADGTSYLSPKQQLAAQGAVALAAAAGGAMLDNQLARDVADGTAIVTGGVAAMGALYQFKVEDAVRAAVGLPASAPAATAALPAPAATAPGGWVGRLNANAPVYQ